MKKVIPISSHGSTKPIRIASFDLGSKNFAASIIVAGKKIKYKAAFMIPPTLLDLKEPFYDQTALLRKTIARILTKYKPKYLIAERYMNRGIKGVQVEILGVLLGVMASLAIERDIPMRLVTASTWKNAVERKRSGFLDRLYSYFPQSKRHRVDAIMIGIYAHNKNFDVNLKKLERYVAALEGSWGEPRQRKPKAKKKK